MKSRNYSESTVMSCITLNKNTNLWFRTIGVRILIKITMRLSWKEVKKVYWGLSLRSFRWNIAKRKKIGLSIVPFRNCKNLKLNSSLPIKGSSTSTIFWKLIKPRPKLQKTSSKLTEAHKCWDRVTVIFRIKTVLEK